MSGSSMDGLDIAMIEIKADMPQINWELVAQDEFPIPSEIKESLSIARTLSIRELALLESTYSEFIATCVNAFTRQQTPPIQLFGVHGHTLLHLPEHKVSWQLANGGLLAERTSLPVVTDFRNQDIALGGVGTPMATLADRDLFPGYDHYLNLGGIANISSRSGDDWSAYDICPCNQWLNHAAALLGFSYDKGGQAAAKGQLIPLLSQSLLKEDYWNQAPPKSIDNAWVAALITTHILPYSSQPQDLLATLVSIISTLISEQITAPNGRVLCTGGGSKNSFLIEKLKQKLASKHVELVMPHAEIIDCKESILIAYAAYLRWRGKANFLSEVTGARADAIGGAVYLPAG